MEKISAKKKAEKYNTFYMYITELLKRILFQLNGMKND